MGWSLTGLPLGSLLGLGAVLASALVGLYLLRIRRQNTLVPFVGLWTALLGPARKLAVHRRLNQLLSLLLQLVLLALLLLALADPRPDRETESGRAIVVLVDVSASMASRVGGASQQTGLEVAGERLSRLIGGLGPRDQMLLVEMGQRPRPLLGWTAERSALTAHAKSLEVLDVEADVEAALELARDALHERARGEVVLLSDGALTFAGKSSAIARGLRISFEPVVEPGSSVEHLENVALVAFAARRYPQGAGAFEVLLSVLNAGAREAEVEVTISSANSQGAHLWPLEVLRLKVPPGQSEPHISADLSGAGSLLQASLRRLDGQSDTIVRDDVAYALLPPERQARVLVVGPTETFVDAALLLDPGLVTHHVTAEAYPPPEPFDITIFQGVFPQREARGGAALYLGAPSRTLAEANFPVSVGRELELFGFDHWQKDAALFRYFDPYDIQVLRGQTLEPRSGDVVLGRSDSGALLVGGQRAEGAFLALGFRPRDSDMVLRAAFPLFLLAAIDHLLPVQAQGQLSSLRTGEPGRFAVPGLARGRAQVTGPWGPLSRTAVLPVQAEQATYLTERAGFYEVTGGDRPIFLAASLNNPRESSLGPQARLELEGKPLARATGFEPQARREPWLWALLAVLGLTLLEWVSYHRRWTV